MSKASDVPVSTTPSYTFREKLEFLKPYWISDQKWKIRGLLAINVGLILTDIALTAGVGFGFQALLNALVAKDLMNFGLYTLATVGGMIGASFAAKGHEYMTSIMAQNWRGWLTKQFNDSWLDGKAYMRLQYNKRFNQNPDQRMTDTIANVTGPTLGLTLGFLRAAAGVVTFAVVLWQISPLMVGAAAVCAVAAHGLSHWVGNPMRNIWKGLMDTEAKFRHALARIRDNAKPIALAGLEPTEKEILNEKFSSLNKMRYAFYKTNRNMNIVSAINDKSASIVPLVMSAPQVLAGTATLGSLELTRRIYEQLYNALSWFPQSYSQISSWSASVSQLMELQKDIEDNKVDIFVKKAPQPEAPAIAPPLKPAGVQP